MTLAGLLHRADPSLRFILTRRASSILSLRRPLPTPPRSSLLASRSSLLLRARITARPRDPPRGADWRAVGPHPDRNRAATGPQPDRNRTATGPQPGRGRAATGQQPGRNRSGPWAPGTRAPGRVALECVCGRLAAALAYHAMGCAGRVGPGRAAQRHPHRRRRPRRPPRRRRRGRRRPAAAGRRRRGRQFRRRPPGPCRRGRRGRRGRGGGGRGAGWGDVGGAGAGGRTRGRGAVPGAAPAVRAGARGAGASTTMVGSN